MTTATTTPRQTAKRLGYYILEGSYAGGYGDLIGRWYYGHRDDNGFRPLGAGYRTQREAWEAALAHHESKPREPKYFDHDGYIGKES